MSHILNPFTQPHTLRSFLLQKPLVDINPKKYAGKSILYAFFTRFCGVGCPFCFFKSAPPLSPRSLCDELSKEGVEKFIQFVKQANVAYLAISGGGEPCNHRSAVLRTITEARADHIVINTSGSWAVNEKAAEIYLKQLYQVWKEREHPCELTLRLSVSQGHSIKLGMKPAFHLISIYKKLFTQHPNFKLAVHTFRNDPSLSKILEEFSESQLTEKPQINASADRQVMKKIPSKFLLKWPDGFQIQIGISRFFHSGLRPNLKQTEKCQQSIKIFQEDLEYSESFFPTVTENLNGQLGLDWAINYNGNVSTWTNQVHDNLHNIYEDSFEKVWTDTFRDPLLFSIIEKGTVYRDRIVSEVNPQAVLRLRSISLRDYSGAVLFEEEKTRLYFTLRVLRDYFKEGRLCMEKVQELPKNLESLITVNDTQHLINLFHSAEYTIFDQYKRKKEFNPIDWRDLLELVKLNHYELTSSQIQLALQYYNSLNPENPILSLDGLIHQRGEIERRLTERLMFMKPLKREDSYEKSNVREHANCFSK
jgi:hypothetical protein